MAMAGARDMALWTPADISTALWLDAADSSTLYNATSGGSLVAADGAVARWEDKSGNARHCTQATLATRALRKIAVQNSLDCLLFNGSRWYQGTASATTGDQRTVLAVCRSPHAGGGSVWSSRTTNGSFLCRAVRHGGVSFVSGDNVTNNVTTTFDITTPMQSFYLQCWQCPSSKIVEYRANGDAKATSGTIITDNGAAGYSVGRLSVNTTQNWPGEIAEIVVFNSLLTLANVQLTEGYLAHKWGLAGSLPVDHPYKNAAPGDSTIQTRRRRDLAGAGL